MAIKVFICGLALVEYIGEGTYKRMGSSLADSATLEKGDFFITDKATAVGLSGGTRFKWHKEVKDCDILTHFSDNEVSISDFDDAELLEECEKREIGFFGAIDDDVTGDGLGDATVDRDDEVVIGNDSELSDKDKNILKDTGDIVANEAKVDEAKVDEAKVDEAKDDEAKDDEAKEGHVWTQENIMDATDDELKALCKKHKIKYGKLKRDDMIGVLLPFLERGE